RQRQMCIRDRSRSTPYKTWPEPYQASMARACKMGSIMAGSAAQVLHHALGFDRYQSGAVH
ncbi:MAG: hypothetical protein EB072_09920, partial [Betaproteobacteria bacterium]|nr:hypothetical protein [Betaproteobacteria bacterium]